MGPGPGPGPDDMAGCCASDELDDGIIGGICSVWRCNIAYKHSKCYHVALL